MPARTLRLVVEYDGTDFAGWQRQKGQRTVQACLEEALARMTGGASESRSESRSESASEGEAEGEGKSEGDRSSRLRVTGAGRTDAGVHARGQVASVRVDSTIPTGGFLRGLNASLPPDIAVVDVSDAAPDFDARRAARGKVYRYRIWNHLVRSPLVARWTWHRRGPLDVEAMRSAAAAFVGEHDFRGFRASDCERRTTVRIIRTFDVDRHGPEIVCTVEGTAFLKNMVRIMVGTLVAAGERELDVAGVRALLAAGDRTRAGVTAPARGLTLVRVIY